MTEETQNELIPLKRLENPLQIFDENEMNKLINEIREKTKDFTPDTNTDKGRREIASMSYKVSRSKTALEKLSNNLTEGWKEQTKAVVDVRIKMSKELDALRDEVRKPLTDYEDAEKKKLADFEQDINAIDANGTTALESWQEVDDGVLEEAKLLVSEWECTTDDAELEHKFNLVKEIAVNKINLAIEKRQTYDKEQAELKALREAEEKRQEEEEEKKRIQAEKDAQAEQERLKAEEDARVEKERAEAAQEALEAAEQEAERVAEKVAEEKDLLTQTLEQNKRDAEEAKIQAEKDAEKARANEREKIQAEENQRLADEKRREENKEHQRKINQEAVEGLVKAGIQKPVAQTAIKAIILGDVPHVKLSY